MAMSTAARAGILAISGVFLNGALAVRLGEGDEAREAARLAEVAFEEEENFGECHDHAGSLVVDKGDTRYANSEVPSGSSCEDDEEWGTDTVHGNPEMKAYLGNCTDPVEINAENIQLLKNYGCHHQFDVVSWAAVSGLQAPHRAPKTGGIICAKAFKFKKDPPAECIKENHPHVFTLFAAVSGKKGPRPVNLPQIKDGAGLNSIQGNYTWMTGQHPRAWADRSSFRRDLTICQKWNALDTVIELVAKGEAAMSSMHIIVGPSDENVACNKNKKAQFVRSKTLKALICFYPMKSVMKAVDVQEIHWHPAGGQSS